jgi:hypothetical protein
MNTSRVATLLASMQLLSAVVLPQIYTLVFSSAWTFSFSIAYVFGAVLCSAFLLLPLAALIFILRDKLFGYVLLPLYPILAFLFGVTPIPFVTYLYGDSYAINLVGIGLVNVLVFLFAVWLCVDRLRHFSPSNKVPDGG